MSDQKEKSFLSLNIKSIVENYDAFLVDMWGVVHNGVESLPGAVYALEQIKSLQKKVSFITNSSRPSSELSALIAKMGIFEGKHYDTILSSGDCVAEKLNDPLNDFFGKSYYHLGEKIQEHPLLTKIKGKMTHDIEKADYILFTSLTPDTNDVLQKALTLDKVIVCANPDVVALHGEKFSYCPGLATQKFEDQGGHAIAYGKPYAPIYHSALRKLGNPALSKVLAIGDSLHTDIQGACTMDINSVFIRSGVHRAESMETLRLKCVQMGIAPTYVMDFFVWDSSKSFHERITRHNR